MFGKEGALFKFDFNVSKILQKVQITLILQYDPNIPLLYQDYPKYYDPYVDTYRNQRSGSSLGIDKILEYIHLAYETWVFNYRIL